MGFQLVEVLRIKGAVSVIEQLAQATDLESQVVVVIEGGKDALHNLFRFSEAKVGLYALITYFYR